MKHNRGQSLLAVIMWATGISIPMFAGVLAWSENQFNKNNDEHLVMKVDIATSQANYENILITLQEIKDALKIKSATVASSTSQRK